jgi:predicted nucleic acid-binding protein
VRRSFFDTNVLLYLFDNREPDKKAAAQELIQKEVEADRASLSTQVLQEFYVNATRKLAFPLSPEEAGARVRDFSRLPLVQVDVPLIPAAIARSQRMSFSLWDAMIVEAALKAGADRLLTEDLQHGQVIEDMRVENPFL